MATKTIELFFENYAQNYLWHKQIVKGRKETKSNPISSSFAFEKLDD